MAWVDFKVCIFSDTPCSCDFRPWNLVMECRTRIRSFAITLTDAIWFCLAIFLISTISFFSCCSSALRSLSSSRMDLSRFRLCSRSTCALQMRPRAL